MRLPPHPGPARVLAAVSGSGVTAIVVVVVLLMAVASFLAMSETALTRMSRVKAIALDEEGRRGSKHLVRLMDDPGRTITPILLLVLIAHLLIATLVGMLTGEAGLLGVGVGILVEAVGVFVLCESAPKTYAVKNPERVSLFAAPVIHAIGSFPPITLLTRGLIGVANLLIPGKGNPLGPSTSEEELLALAEVASDEDVIEVEERELIHSIIEFGDTITREVMVARPDLVTVDARTTIADAFEVALLAGFSRMPVYEGTIDDILGLVYLKDLARADRDGRGEQAVRELVRDATVVPETKRVAELLREMQLGRFHMAVVVDEHGSVAGVVTLEDLLEELVGDIVDEYDREAPKIVRNDDGSIAVTGTINVEELNDELDLAIPTDDDWDTLAGYLFHRLGHVPEEGEVVHHAGLTLTVAAMAGNRIESVVVRPYVAAPAEETSGSDRME